MTRAQTQSLIEVGIFYSLVHLVIWGSLIWRPPSVLILITMLTVCITSNILHKDSREKIGLSREKFWPNFKLIAPWALLVLPLIGFGWGKRPLEGWTGAFILLGYPVWAFIQEYALLGFVANRLEEGLSTSSTGLVPWLNGFLFSLAHAPNPVLMSVTFFSGVLFTRIFLKERHLIPLALVHALFGASLGQMLSDWPGVMSVGPGFLRRFNI